MEIYIGLYLVGSMLGLGLEFDSIFDEDQHYSGWTMLLFVATAVLLSWFFVGYVMSKYLRQKTGAVD